MSRAEVPLSIVVGSIQGWPEIEICVRAAQAAAETVGGELIVIDGSGLPRPPVEALSPATTWLEAPGESVFQLRLRGYQASRGEVVAITEDHCVAPRDWGERILEAHAEHPHAAAIGGAVENGATGEAIDWASFLIVQVAVMAPIRSGAATRLSGAVNVSYKRAALDGIEGNDGMGAMDLLHQKALLERGERLVADDRIRVSHDQSLGFTGTLLAHYHAGRTMSAFRRRQMTPADWLRFVGAFAVPWARFARILGIGMRKGYGGKLLVTAPAVVLLLYSQAVGQFLGYWRGAGDSASQLQ